MPDRRPRQPAGASAGDVTTVCGICPGGCAVKVSVQDNSIRRVRRTPGHPLDLLCPRGARAREIVESPDRLLYPMRRHRLRGRTRLRRVSWEEAYRFLVGRIHEIAGEHGPRALCTYTGRGNFDFALNENFAPAGTIESSANAVLFPFGSPSATGVGSLCYAAYGMIAPRACLGEGMREMRADIDEAELIVVWGANPATDSPRSSQDRLTRARGRGTRVVVIDHRRTRTARAEGAEWIGIRPGTDGALALGLMRVLVDEGLEDRDFLDRWSHGFDELEVYLQGFPPEEVEAITGVPAGRIVALARDMARTERCCVLTYTGLEYSNSGVQAVRGVWCVQALAGNLDVPGGNVFKPRDRLKLRRNLTDPPPDGPLPFGAEEYPLFYEARREAHAALLPRAVLEGRPYPVRGLIVGGSSILTAWPDPDLWARVLEALDLLVVIDCFPTGDAEFADLVLPAATGFESLSYVVHDDNFVQLRQPVVRPRGEARSDYRIWAELAHRLGYGERWPPDEEEMVARALEGSGITLEELRRRPEGVQLPPPEPRRRKWERGELREDGAPGFATPTGKFEFASEWLRSHGYDALPVYTEPTEGPRAAPALAQRFPLVLNTGARSLHMFRSQHRNIPSLAAREPVPVAVLHPRDATCRGIRDGDPVLLRTSRGEVAFRAIVTRDIVPGVVEASMGGGGPLGSAEWRAGNVNRLTDLENRDPLSGFPVFKALLCEVERVQGAPSTEAAEPPSSKVTSRSSSASFSSERES